MQSTKSNNQRSFEDVSSGSFSFVSIIRKMFGNKKKEESEEMKRLIGDNPQKNSSFKDSKPSTTYCYRAPEALAVYADSVEQCTENKELLIKRRKIARELSTQPIYKVHLTTKKKREYSYYFIKLNLKNPVVIDIKDANSCFVETNSLCLVRTTDKGRILWQSKYAIGNCFREAIITYFN
jgi:hypothetical protein